MEISPDGKPQTGMPLESQYVVYLTAGLTERLNAKWVIIYGICQTSIATAILMFLFKKTFFHPEDHHVGVTLTVEGQ